jgi:hypothetical protein
MVQAAVQVAAVYPEQCSRCDPTRVLVPKKLYWRFDHQTTSLITAARTCFVYSGCHRIPASAFADLPSTFSDPANVVGPQQKYLYEYNPSDCPFATKFLLVSLVAAANDNYNKAVYVASYRVTDITLVHARRGERLSNPRDSRPLHREYMGIAFLRADLSIIRTLPWLRSPLWWQTFVIQSGRRAVYYRYEPLPRVDQCSDDVAPHCPERKNI